MTKRRRKKLGEEGLWSATYPGRKKKKRRKAKLKRHLWTTGPQGQHARPLQRSTRTRRKKPRKVKEKGAKRRRARRRRTGGKARREEEDRGGWRIHPYKEEEKAKAVAKEATMKEGVA